MKIVLKLAEFLTSNWNPILILKKIIVAFIHFQVKSLFQVKLK